MIRGLTTFILASSALELGVSVRQSLKVDHAGQSAHLTSSIASVVESRKAGNEQEVQDKLRDLASATPSLNFNEIVQVLIDNITSEVQSMIMRGKNATDDEMKRRIQQLDTDTYAAMEAKRAADDADEAWFECVRGEKELQEIEEQKQQEVERAQEATVIPCSGRDDSKIYSGKAPEPMQLTCDFSQGDECDTELQKITQAVTERLQSLKQEVGQQKSVWTGYSEQCNEAWEAHARAEADLELAERERTQKQGECSLLKGKRGIAICTFGEALQVKCAAFSSYNEIKEQLDQQGNVHSQVDRIAEWATTEVTRCLLQDQIDNDVLSDPAQARQSLEACTASTDFEAQGGDLSRQSKQEQVDTLMTEERFTCVDLHFEFYNGQAWDVNRQADPISSGYQIVAFAPEATLDQEQEQFEICEGGPGKTTQ